MILLISANFPPEPVAAACLSYDLAIALSEKNEVTVVTPKPSRPCGFSFNAGTASHGEFEHIILNSYTCPKSTIFGRMLESFSFGKHAVKIINKRRKEIDCIYISAWPLLAQYLIVNASVKYAIPSIVHVQDIYPESLSNKIRFIGNYVNKCLLPLDKYILNHASYIVVNSETMRSTFEATRGISGQKIILVKNWQDERKFIMTGNIPKTSLFKQSENRSFIFMYLGNIGPVAGVDFLIRSFIMANLQDALLVIAGSGSQKEKCMQIAELYKSKNIIFTDVPSGKVTEMQDNADVLLLPIKRGASTSSIPSKLPAYMFSKKPIIACVEYESDIARAIHQSNCGWIVTPEDTDALVFAMRNAVSIPKEDLLLYGSNGFNFALENYSKNKNLQLLVSGVLQTLTA